MPMNYHAEGGRVHDETGRLICLVAEPLDAPRVAAALTESAAREAAKTVTFPTSKYLVAEKRVWVRQDNGLYRDSTGAGRHPAAESFADAPVPAAIVALAEWNDLIGASDRQTRGYGDVHAVVDAARLAVEATDSLGLPYD